MEASHSVSTTTGQPKVTVSTLRPFEQQRQHHTNPLRHKQPWEEISLRVIKEVISLYNLKKTKWGEIVF